MKKTLLLAVAAFATTAAMAQEAAFTSNGTWTVPPGVTTIDVMVIGAGGNGAINGSGGGGGGGFASGTFSVSPGTVYTITVGTAGSLTPTSVMPLGIQATPGISSVYSSAALGGLGGVGSGGSVNYSGGAGGNGTFTYFGGGGGGAAGPAGNGNNGGSTPPWSGVCLYPGGDPGLSGGSPAGNGGKGSGFTDVSCSATDPATPGNDYGGGGAGGNGNGGAPSNGAGGYVRINWCGTIDAPTGDSVQSFCMQDSATIESLASTGSNIQWYSSDTGSMPLMAGTMLENGSYYASQTVSGCESEDRLEVSVSIDTVDVSTTADGNVITASASDATFQWIDCLDNQPIAGATSAVFTAVANGNYAVVVTQNGCSDTSACVAVTTTGVGATAQSGSSIYPNPASEMIMIKVAPELIGAPYFITDALGRKVKTGVIRQAATGISIHNLANGIYHFQAGRQPGQTFKVVKQ